MKNMDSLKKITSKAKKPETLPVEKMMAIGYQPKTTNCWILEIEGIDYFFTKSASRPKFFLIGNEWITGMMQFTFYDGIAPSTASQIWEWMKTKSKRSADLKMLDPLGSVVEYWSLEGLMLETVDFGELCYTKSEARTISIECSCSKAELIY